MKRWTCLLLVLCMLVGLTPGFAEGSGEDGALSIAETSLPTDTPAATDAPVSTDTPTPTDVPVPTDTPTPTDAPTPTDVPVPTDTPTPTGVPVPTDTPTPTDAPVSTDTPTPTDTPVPTGTPTPTKTPTSTKIPLPSPIPSPVPEDFKPKVPGPAWLNVAEDSYNSLSLTWAAVPGAIGYQIEQSTSRISGYLVVVNTGAAATSRKITGLTCGTLYYFRVRAVLAAGPTDTSSVAFGTPKPGTPSITSCAVDSISKVKITWSLVPGATGYDIYRGTDSGTPTRIYTSASATVNTYLDSTVVMGNRYTYSIIAYRTVGVNKFEGNASASYTLECLPPPPTGLAATSPAINSIELTWKVVTGATGYVIYRDTGDGLGYREVSSVTALKYTDSGLILGQTYKYKVASYVTVSGVRVVGDGSAEQSAIATVPKVEKVKLTNYINKIVISWDPIAMASGYQVQYRTYNPPQAAGAWQTVTVQGATSYELPSLGSGLGFQFRVCGYVLISGTHFPQPRNWSDLLIGVTKPKPPEDFSVSLKNYAALQLNWTAPASSNSSGYEIWRAFKTDGMKLLDVTNTPRFTTYVDRNLITGALHSYKVRAYVVIGSVKYYSAFTAVKSGTPVNHPVTGVTATSVDSTSIKVTWDACPGASGYQIAMQKAGETSFTIMATVGASALEYTLRGLTTGVNYTFRVRAFRDVSGVRVPGLYSLSNAPLDIAMPLPAKPTGATITIANEKTLTLRWNLVPGATGYEIWRSITGPSTNVPFTKTDTVITTTAPTITWKDQGPGCFYSYYIVPFVTVGGVQRKGPPSDTVTKRMIPTAPTAFAAKGTNVGNNLLTWKAVDFPSVNALVCGYEIYYYDAATNAFKLLKDIPNPTTQQFRDALITIGQTKQYRIRSYVISEGIKVPSTYSLVSSVKTLPTRVRTINVKSNSYNTMLLSWSTDGTARRFQILRGTTPNNLVAYDAITPSSGSIFPAGSVTYQDTSVVTGTTYYYQVRPINVVYGYLSEVSSGRAIPDAPVLKSANAVDVGRIYMNWDPGVAGSSGYNVYYWVGNTTGPKRFLTYVANKPAAGWGYTASGLQMNTTYYFAITSVRYVNGVAVESELSAIKSATTKPPAPKNLVAVGLPGERVQLTWNAVSRATGYVVQSCGTPAGNYTTLVTVPASSGTTVTLTKQLALKPMYYRVYAYTTINGVTSIGATSTPVRATPQP